MGFIPQVICQRCGSKFSAILHRCPNCGTPKKFRHSRHVLDTIPSVVKGTPDIKAANRGTNMGFIPQVICQRCGSKFSAIRHRCPNCGTSKKFKSSSRATCAAASVVKDTPDIKAANGKQNWNGTQVEGDIEKKIAELRALSNEVTARAQIACEFDEDANDTSISLEEALAIRDEKLRKLGLD